MACSPSRSVAPASRDVTSRRTGPHSEPPEAVRVVETPFERGTKSVRIAAGREAAGIRDQGHASSWSPGAELRRVGLDQGRGGRAAACRCASCAADGTALARTSVGRARTGVAGSAVLVRQHADRSRRDRRNRGRGPRRGANRFRVADARRRAQERHAAARLARGAPWARARVHPLAGRLVRLDLQVAGRHRAAGLARLSPERNLGRLLRLLRLRHRRVPGADPSARDRPVDRAAGA